MTILRSPTPPKSMVITPLRHRKKWHHDTFVSLHSLALSMTTLDHDEGATTKFRLAPRYHGRNDDDHDQHTDGHYEKRPHFINDDSIQSPAVHRRYLRRGSRTPSMLRHTALLETLTTTAAAADPEERTTTTNDSHHHNNHVVTVGCDNQFRDTTTTFWNTTPPPPPQNESTLGIQSIPLLETL